MKIVIPMSGSGQRFLEAGYKDPKPLIIVDGKPIIEHIVNLFPGEKDFIFICSSEHLKNTNMKEVLRRITLRPEIVEIAPHKRGPVYAVSQIFDLIGNDEEAIVNYCDFSKYWDYKGFLKHTRERNADGAIPSYKGFHPHMLGTTNYAFIRDAKQWMLEIREKQPFTDNRMQEYASDGTYYFKKWSYVKKYFRQLMDENINIKGEYYVSMVFNLMKKDDLKISVYEIQHMLQWGTPGDLEEYKNWSGYFKKIVTRRENIKTRKNSIDLIPLAGKGDRFIRDGYKDPKPLINVSGKPMIIQAYACLPDSEKQIFICLAEHLDNYPLENEILKVYPKAKIIKLAKVTEGQACTCEAGLKGEDMEVPLLIAACDNGMLWDKEQYENFLDDKKVDAVVWSFRHHPSSQKNPQMYGWIKTDEENNVLGVSVKKPISDNPYKDHAIVGTFYFRKARYFIEALKRMYENNIRVNNEFYVDSCVNELIEMGLSVKVFEVDSYICWGTPNDLKTYEYWQSFFHKCSWHPYSLEKDITMNIDRADEFDKKFKRFEQPYR